MIEADDKIESFILDSLSQEYEQIIADRTISICVYRINENCFTPFFECLFIKEESSNVFCFPQEKLYENDDVIYENDDLIYENNDLIHENDALIQENDDAIYDLQYRIIDCIIRHYDIAMTDISIMGFFENKTAGKGGRGDICLFLPVSFISSNYRQSLENRL